jgi:lipopolysaccharide transport protein LptA
MMKSMAVVGLFAMVCLAVKASAVSLPERAQTGVAPAGAVSPVAAFVAPGATGESARVAVDAGDGVVAGTGEIGFDALATGAIARVAATGAVSGAAFGSTPTNQTVITSRQLLFDYKRSIALFEGDVEVVDPQMHMFSDRLIVVFGASNEVLTVTALDNVRFDCGDRKGTCDRTIYRVPLGEVLLTGSPVLKRANGEVLKGERITYWMDREVAVCDKGEVVLPPQAVKEKP